MMQVHQSPRTVHSKGDLGPPIYRLFSVNYYCMLVGYDFTCILLDSRRLQIL